jgi:hypothetical protein
MRDPTKGDIAEVKAWLAELIQPIDEAQMFIDRARQRGAIIKKGRHTEKVLEEMLTELFKERRDAKGQGA